MAGAPLPGDILPCVGANTKPPPAKTVNEWYGELSDLIIASPDATTFELAASMGRTPRWVAIIRGSDTFADFHSKRVKGKIVTIQDKTKTLVELALDHLTSRVETLGSVMKTEELHEIVDKGSKRLGMDKSSHPTHLAVNVGVTVGREDLARARDRMQSAFGVEVDSPAPQPLSQSLKFESPKESTVTDAEIVE